MPSGSGYQAAHVRRKRPERHHRLGGVERPLGFDPLSGAVKERVAAINAAQRAKRRAGLGLRADWFAATPVHRMAEDHQAGLGARRVVSTRGTEAEFRASARSPEPGKRSPR
jgi:hypothetical protein